ncbi:MAG: GTP-binding protein, partial [Nocardioidaceae bacterium]
MRTLNLGILAHVDAGKTTLTERLLYTAGVVADVGRVDDGSTQTDTLALERQRGITIKSAVVSFVIDDVAVNLIDTPGHPDFIAEVDRVLSVLDGAVLVVSAVKGVQPQTRVLMRALQRLRVPTLIFVNKLDCAGAEYDAVVQSVAERLATASIAMGLASGLGSAEASFAPYDGDDDGFATELVDLLTDHDDGLLTDYVEDERAVSYRHLRVSLATQTKQARVHPAFFGSAATGAGVDELVSGITELLPAAQGRADGPGSGTVFKVARGPAGQRIAYVRMSSGTIRVRDRVQSGQATSGRVTAIRTFDRGGDVSVGSIAAGQIGMVWGLGDVRIGDVVGEPGTTSPVSAHHFAPPTLETVVSPTHATDKGALHAALTQLAEQDPLINLRQDDSRQEMSLSLYGEVQKEVIQATLADEFGLEVSFSETTQICIERPVGTGTALETIAVDRNPFLATVGLRVEPGPVGS